MTDFNATAAALTKAAQEFKAVKRNKNGVAHGNSMTPIRRRLVLELKAAGETSDDAWAMAWDLSNRNQKI